MARRKPPPGRNAETTASRSQREPRTAEPAYRQPGPVNVIAVSELARLTTAIATPVVHALLDHGQPRDRVGRQSWLRDPSLTRLAWSDRQIVVTTVRSLARWWGWLAPLGAAQIERSLALAVLLDAKDVPPITRQWARVCGWNEGRLVALGDAPDWTSKTAGFKRLFGAAPPTVDPWKLFPSWLRSALPEPPGSEPIKSKYVRVLAALQSVAPLWVRAQGPGARRVWDELRSQGLKPWEHRGIANAARVEDDVELARLPAVKRGALVLHDLASQWVGACCDPHPGERWWVVNAERAQETIHLAALMEGRGSVVASHAKPAVVRALTMTARSTPFRNVHAKPHDRKHLAGKAMSFDGVLVTPPSTSMGLWRRRPEWRWLNPAAGPETFAADQLAMLEYGARGVKHSGLLLYAVPTIARHETTHIVAEFSAKHPDFKLKPFSDPLKPADRAPTALMWPNESDHDAWFIARWMKIGNAE